jgi:hypothetical protein
MKKKSYAKTAAEMDTRIDAGESVFDVVEVSRAEVVP